MWLIAFLVQILRVSRFFPEDDDKDRHKQLLISDDNLKANEYLYRRVAVQDVVAAHVQAQAKAKEVWSWDLLPRPFPSLFASSPRWRPGTRKRRCPSRHRVLSQFRPLCSSNSALSSSRALPCLREATATTWRIAPLMWSVCGGAGGSPTHGTKGVNIRGTY
jgi:hypothetical protein